MFPRILGITPLLAQAVRDVHLVLLARVRPSSLQANLFRDLLRSLIQLVHQYQQGRRLQQEYLRRLPARRPKLNRLYFRSQLRQRRNQAWTRSFRLKSLLLKKTGLGNE